MLGMAAQIEQEPAAQVQLAHPDAHRRRRLRATFVNDHDGRGVDAQHQFDAAGVQQNVARRVVADHVFQIGQALCQLLDFGAGHAAGAARHEGLRHGVVDHLDLRLLRAGVHAQQLQALPQLRQQLRQQLHHLRALGTVGLGAGHPHQVRGGAFVGQRGRILRAVAHRRGCQHVDPGLEHEVPNRFGHRHTLEHLAQLDRVLHRQRFLLLDLLRHRRQLPCRALAGQVFAQELAKLFVDQLEHAPPGLGVLLDHLHDALDLDLEPAALHRRRVKAQHAGAHAVDQLPRRVRDAAEKLRLGHRHAQHRNLQAGKPHAHAGRNALFGQNGLEHQRDDLDDGLLAGRVGLLLQRLGASAHLLGGALHRLRRRQVRAGNRRRARHARALAHLGRGEQRIGRSQRRRQSRRRHQPVLAVEIVDPVAEQAPQLAQHTLRPLAHPHHRRAGGHHARFALGARQRRRVHGRHRTGWRQPGTRRTRRHVRGRPGSGRPTCSIALRAHAMRRSAGQAWRGVAHRRRTPSARQAAAAAKVHAPRSGTHRQPAATAHRHHERGRKTLIRRPGHSGATSTGMTGAACSRHGVGKNAGPRTAAGQAVRGQGTRRCPGGAASASATRCCVKPIAKTRAAGAAASATGPVRHGHEHGGCKTRRSLAGAASARNSPRASRRVGGPAGPGGRHGRGVCPRAVWIARMTAAGRAPGGRRHGRVKTGVRRAAIACAARRAGSTRERTAIA